MIGSELASLAVQIVLGVLLVTGTRQVWELVVLQAPAAPLRVLLACLDRPRAADRAAGAAPAGERLHEHRALLGDVFGAAAGGALVATIGAGWAILLDAATFAASAVLLVRMRIAGAATAAQRRSTSSATSPTAGTPSPSTPGSGC